MQVVLYSHKGFHVELQGFSGPSISKEISDGPSEPAESKVKSHKENLPGYLGTIEKQVEQQQLEVCIVHI